jgi:putative secretion ATPase (PEP-CTERM system associated)
MMYNSFFGFTHKPFQLTPDPEFLFLSRVHKRALTYLNYGIADNSGFILITGEIGTGKTTLIRSMLKKIPQKIKIARINNTKVGSAQLISMINEEFGIDTTGDDKTRMLSKLTDFLIDQYAKGGRSMIIVDEAQNLSPTLLEEIRLLSNLETDKSKLLQIILIGQPELKNILLRSDLEQLRQRIAVSAHISPLSREETEAYIRHRLKVAGNENAIIFGDGVMDELHAFAGGIPRMINIACDFILVAAYAEGLKTIDADLVKEITKELLISGNGNGAPCHSGPGTASPEEFTDIRNSLASISMRMRNLEAVVMEMQKRFDDIRPTSSMVHDKNGFPDTRKDELVKKDYRVPDKEEILRKRVESILKGMPSAKS